MKGIEVFENGFGDTVEVVSGNFDIKFRDKNKRGKDVIKSASYSLSAGEALTLFLVIAGKIDLYFGDTSETLEQCLAKMTLS